MYDGRSSLDLSGVGRSSGQGAIGLGWKTKQGALGDEVRIRSEEDGEEVVE